MESATLNRIINRLLEIGSKSGKQVPLSETEITQLCMVSRDIFLRQPNLLEIEAPIYICGFSFPLSLLIRYGFFSFVGIRLHKTVF